MYQAKRWHSDYPAPMVPVSNEVGNLFVDDFFVYNDDKLGSTIGKLLSCYIKVTFIYMYISTCTCMFSYYIV